MEHWGVIGSRVSNRRAGGTLLIIGAVLSLTVGLGAFIVGFVMMLVGGVLGLTFSQEQHELIRERAVEQPYRPPAQRAAT